MRMLQCLACMIAASLPAALPAQPASNEWRPIHRDTAAEFFVDPATLRRQGPGFTIQARAVFHTPQDGIAAFNSLMLYDCAARTLVLLHITQLRPDGSIAVDGDTAEADRTPDPIAPESANESVLNLYCPR